MNSAIKRSSFLQAVCLVIAAFVLTGCPALESISKGLSDFQREVDALRASPQASISDFSPRGIAVYLSAWPNVNTGAEFLQWLPPQFKEDWVMMTRSESLQTGTATSPRIILRNGNNFKQVFAFTLKADASFPLAHPDVIEYMQFDDATQKFRFHEIDLRKSSPLLRMSEDNANCLHCHGGSPENLRPNWDAYDSWGGMLPFNRDRIYQNSVEELAMRTILNPAARPDLAPIISQLTLPQGITRAGDGSISINYNSADPSSSTRNDYNFDGGPASTPPPGAPAGTAVSHGGLFRTIDQATGSSTSDVDGDADQGRGVELFDELTTLNARRIAQELVTRPTTFIDVRPVALAIVNGCVTAANINSFMIDSGGTDRRPFFETSHGMMNFSSLLIDTESRRRSLPRRKADIQKMNLDGSDGRSSGLIGTYAVGISADLNRVRQEVFRRSLAFPADSITRLMNDREVYNPS
ncbi:MAG: hypothetical protein HP490_03085, partial [Nitrospira sp.]|nr:hypothetical protein [Nitrospira sp.]